MEFINTIEEFTWIKHYNGQFLSRPENYLKIFFSWSIVLTNVLILAIRPVDRNSRKEHLIQLKGHIQGKLCTMIIIDL